MPGTTPARRLRVAIRGAVQGVGFRPFVYRLALRHDLRGWVVNDAQGVFIEVESDDAALTAFLAALELEKPARAFIQSLESTWLDPVGFHGFEIRHSESRGAISALVLPDIALCDDCRAEILDPTNRRHRYAFTNCTNCGPRFTIIDALPYDRASTTMRGFAMCPACEAEYRDPLDRRFHAQPNACPDCGPHVELWRPDGSIVATHERALLDAAAAIRDGAIVAVKGLGGFHLFVDATNADAVARLRSRKHREEKPLALMLASIDDAEAFCTVSPIERRLLLSPEAPIVLIDRRETAPVSADGSSIGAGAPLAANLAPIAANVAPSSRTLGVMLAATPLHVLLLGEVGRPVVATSGNLSEEPICIDEREAIGRLGAIADLLLVHDRPITRHVDDAIVRVIAGRETMIRRARGYAPLPLPIAGADRVLAVGAHQKNAVAVAVGGNVFVSQHIGDLATEPAHAAFRGVIASFEKLYETTPTIVACDLHPDYLSTHHAAGLGLPVIGVQHHHAHVLSCMADNDLDGPVLGIAWDGTGYGTDGTIWGGEFLLVPRRDAPDASTFERVAHLRTFRIPGGDASVREPRRTALGLLYELHGDALFDDRTHADLAPLVALDARERGLIAAMLRRGVNAPTTSSAGRLFDAIASIAGIRQRCGYEGQAAIELESAIVATDDAYPIGLIDHGPTQVVDWGAMIGAIVDDARRGVSAGIIAARAHNALVESMVAVARHVGCDRIALSGGCFQNRYLAERATRRLDDEGFEVYRHQRVPPNDGGIALGQVAAVVRRQG